MTIRDQAAQAAPPPVRLWRPHPVRPLRLLHGRGDQEGALRLLPLHRLPGKCPEPYAREEVIERQFAELLKGLHLESTVLTWVTKALRESQRDEKRFHEQALARLQAEHDQLDRCLEEMYLDKLDGRISAAFYDRKSAEWRAEQEGLQAVIEDHRQASRTYIDAGVRLLELASRAHELFLKRGSAKNGSC